MLLSTQKFQQDSQLKTAVLHLPGEEIKLPIISGTEDEQAIDITSLRDETGYITLDPGYSNTGACESKITFIDGESGILRYRGYPIEELAEHSTFVETAWLLIYGELPTAAQLARFRELLTEQELLHEGMRQPLRRVSATRASHGNALGHDQRVRLLSPGAARHRS